MSKYINLDDPEVEYSHNYGQTEVYLVRSEAERIDLVRCGECKHWHEIKSMELWTDRLGRCDAPRNRFNHHAAYHERFYCADGKRREDDKEAD